VKVLSRRSGLKKKGEQHTIRNILSEFATNSSETERNVELLKDFHHLGKDFILLTLQKNGGDVEKAQLELFEIALKNQPPVNLESLIQQLSQFKELGRDVIIENLKQNQWDVDGAMMSLFKCHQVQREEQERKRREEQRKIREEQERERKAKEEQERKIKEQQERLKLEQEQLKKKEELERRIREEHERKIKEEKKIREEKRQVEMKFKMEQELQAKEEQERERKIKEHQERLKLEQEQLKKKEELERRIREEHERKIREEHERKIRDEQERQQHQRLELERLRIEQERREELRLKEENERKLLEERLKLEKVLKEQEERRKEEIKRMIMEDKMSRQKQGEDPIETKIKQIQVPDSNQSEKPILYPLEGRIINPLEASSIDFVHIGDSKPKPNDIVVKLIAKPEHVDCSEAINVIVEHTGQPSSTDWIGLYPNEDCSDKEYLTYIWVTQDSRSYTIKAPSKPGTYVFKYFVSVNKSSNCWAYSNPFRVGPAYSLTPTILGTLQVSIKVEQTHGSHSSSAWIAMYETEKDNKKYSGNYQYIGDKKEFFFVAPKFGRWEFRIFPSKDYVHTDSVFVDLN